MSGKLDDILGLVLAVGSVAIALIYAWRCQKPPKG
jgi:hypothetical protein